MTCHRSHDDDLDRPVPPDELSNADLCMPSRAQWRKIDLAVSRVQTALDRVYAQKAHPDGLAILGRAEAALNDLADRAQGKTR